jgi:2,3-dihydroxyphenylpropionate 1,2-dioxygenase
MARAFVGISHTPLMGLNPIGKAAELTLHQALADLRARVHAFAPERIVLIAPDHYNGFFNALMPPFCVGSQAWSVGDYLSRAGQLRVDADCALGLASHLLAADIDVAVSRAMEVDHGFAQPLELLWGSLDTPPVVPVFLNAVAPPTIPRLRRCRALGRAIGDYLDTDATRTLVIGSGGLSHEPPVPTLDHPDLAVRQRITHRTDATKDERDAKMRRVMAAGVSLAAGEGTIKPLNPDWDLRWMDAMAGTDHDLDTLCTLSEDSIDRDGGHSAHESKTWLVARSAMPRNPSGRAVRPLLRHYQAIPEYIAGFGLMMIADT